MGLVRLESVIQHYDWGDTQAIAQALGRRASGRPEAELWMGAHPRCPSLLASPVDACADLAALIESEPLRYLGPVTAQRYAELPFLLKVLAAGSPLSLQAHPSQDQAQRGYAQEEAAGIPFSDARRNYRDANHKPELIFALGDFHALAGFRLPHRAARLSELFLSNASGGVRTLLSAFVAAPTLAGLEAYFRGLFALDEAELRTSIAAAASMTRLPCPEAEVFAPWLKRLAEKYPADPGVLASLLIRYFHLQPGQALFLGPRQLHSYLGGLGVEVMASSDNVLRGGLSSKHIDVPELCSVLDFNEGSAVPFVAQTRVSGGFTWSQFETPAQEFQLSLLEAGGVGEEKLESQAPEIWLGLEGMLRLESEGQIQSLSQGDQVFVSPSGALKISGEGRAVRASLP